LRQGINRGFFYAADCNQFWELIDKVTRGKNKKSVLWIKKIGSEITNEGAIKLKKKRKLLRNSRKI